MVNYLTENNYLVDKICTQFSCLWYDLMVCIRINSCLVTNLPMNVLLLSLVCGWIKETTWMYVAVKPQLGHTYQANPSCPCYNHYMHPSSMVMWCKVKYTDFQFENSNNIISIISYNQFLIDRDSCSDIVGYFYDVAPGWMYKNWQRKLAWIQIYLPGIETTY